MSHHAQWLRRIQHLGFGGGAVEIPALTSVTLNPANPYDHSFRFRCGLNDGSLCPARS